MKNVFLILWGAFIASGWWGFGLFRYHEVEADLIPAWFLFLFIPVIIASLVALVFIILEFIVACHKNWNE